MKHKSLEELNEAFMLEAAANQAAMYHEKYKDKVELLENNAVWKKIRSVDDYDIIALGKMLDSWNLVEAFYEADNSVADLGVLPRIAHDVITVSMLTSPMAVVASIQPIEAERGFVLFERVLAGEARGNLTNEQVIASPQVGVQEIPSGYAAAGIIAESAGTGDGSTVAFASTLANIPVLPRRLSVNATVGAAAIRGEDDGNGNIVGAGIADGSTINYTTGVYSITFTTAPDNGTAVTIDYSVNFEAATNVPAIETDLLDINVIARPYALRSSLGMFKAFKLAKEYGMGAAQDRMAQKLVDTLNIEMFGDLVRRATAVYANTGTTSFTKTTPSGISDVDHRRGMKLALATAESKIIAAAGRGTRSYYIGGTTFCEWCSTQVGWTLLYDGKSISGAHLYGTLDGVPVIRIPADTTIIGTDDAIVGYKGDQFDGALYYAPYMPLTTTGMIPTTNVLVQQRAVASWSAVGVATAQFLTKFSLT
jgi:hypothetical protein